MKSLVPPGTLASCVGIQHSFNHMIKTDLKIIRFSGKAQGTLIFRLKGAMLSNYATPAMTLIY